MEETRSIRSLLTKELCEKLVQSSSLTIGCNVLITDDRGYVIASNNREREGIFHEASLEVLETGREAYHDEAAARKLEGTRPGMTIPLLAEDRVVGTIGITGLPQEVSRYALLLQEMSAIFLSFQSRQQTSAQLDSRKQTLLRDVLTFDRRIRQPREIYAVAYEMGVDLNLPRAAIVIRLTPEALDGMGLTALEAVGQKTRRLLERFFPRSQDFVCPQSDAECVLLACLTEDRDMGRLLGTCGELESALQREGQRVRIGVGGPAEDLEGLRGSYEDACFALRVMQTGVRRETCLASRDLSLERLAAALPEEPCQSVAVECFDRILASPKREEILEIVDQWCRERFRFAKTAEALHIHKSTLVYRFQRIREICGLDLYDFERVTALFLLSIRRRLS